MIIMSVDVGMARTGIAVCDKNEVLASPVCVIEEYNEKRRLERVAEKSRELGAEIIVVGLPKNMNGSEGEKATLCRNFAQELQELVSCKVELCDERATTMLAHTYLNMNDVKGKKRKQTVDAVAATIILEDFLQIRKNKK